MSRKVIKHTLLAETITEKKYLSKNLYVIF